MPAMFDMSTTLNTSPRFQPLRVGPGTQGRSSHGGWTLLELSMVLVVAAGLLLTGLVVWQRTVRTHQATQVTASVNNVLKNLGDTFFGAATLAGVNTQALIQLGVWPQTRIQTTNGVRQVRHELGGAEWVEVVPVNYQRDLGTQVGTSLPANTAYRHIVTHVPTEACAILVNELSTISRYVVVLPYNAAHDGAGMANGYALDPALGVTAKVDGARISPASLDAACHSNNSTDGLHTLEFIVTL